MAFIVIAVSVCIVLVFFKYSRRLAYVLAALCIAFLVGYEYYAGKVSLNEKTAYLDQIKAEAFYAAQTHCPGRSPVAVKIANSSPVTLYGVKIELSARESGDGAEELLVRGRLKDLDAEILAGASRLFCVGGDNAYDINRMKENGLDPEKAVWTAVPVSHILTDPRIGTPSSRNNATDR